MSTHWGNKGFSCALGTGSRKNFVAMKKCLFVILAVFLMCKMEAQTPSYDLEVEGIQYNIISLSDLTLCAVGISNPYASTLEIPREVGYNGRIFNICRVDITSSCDSVCEVILPDHLEYVCIEGCNAEELSLNAEVLAGFSNCPRLKRVIIGPATAQISNGSFRNCSIEKLVLEDGNSVLFLEPLGFSNLPFSSSSIDTLYCGRNLFDKDISSNSNVIQTPYFIFEHCGISVVEFGQYVNAIYGRAFDNVKHLDVPENVVQMRYFWSDSLEDISINSKYFEYYKGKPGQCWPNQEPFLANCEKLDSVYTNISFGGNLFTDLSCHKFVIGPSAGMNSNNISVIGNNACVMVYKKVPLHNNYPVFSNETYLYTPLYVPRGTKEAYQAAEGWRNFFYNEEFDWNVSINAVSSNPEFGSVEGGGLYEYGEYVTLTANPNDGFHFVNWTDGGEAVCFDRIYTFMVEGDRTLTANFAIGNSVNISANSNNSEFGAIEGDGIYSYGAIVVLKAFPNSGCTFQNWTENGLVVCSETTYSFVAENDRNLIANFGGTGVEENEEASKVFVYVRDNMLFVEGVDKLSEITVYNVQGQSVYKGLGRKISIPRVGVYIVAVENRRIKVVVE